MITFPTTNPKALSDAFDNAIRRNDITTWEKDSDGDYFHKASQWSKRAWLQPEIISGASLRYTILFPQITDDKRSVYAFHSTRIVETFINHFHNMFGPEAKITPNAVGKDNAF